MKKENYNMKTKPVKRCREDVIFDTVIFIILTLILFVVAYPLYWVIISSFSDPTAVSAGNCCTECIVLLAYPCRGALRRAG